jgi:glycosyltransferase involved in cell wall biosynthesis
VQLNESPLGYLGRIVRIALVANTAWYLHNFRRNLMRALQQDGHHVIAVGGDGPFGQRLREQGFEHHAVPFSSAGTKPWQELATVLALRGVLRRERVQLVLSWTPKGNLYAALAGRRLLTGPRWQQIMNVSGLGRAVTSPGPASRVVNLLYRHTAAGARWVFFQNEDDHQLFLERGYVAQDRSSRLAGSGVDLQAFKPAPLPSVEPGTCVFLMMARLLWDKGVGEYVEAARSLRAAWPQARFQLLGPLDASPRSGVPRAVLAEWVAAGVVEYLGETDDVRPHLHAADCVVLPSYREGVSRALLEWASCARPLIASDVPGCREVIDADRSGLLCRSADAQDLAAKMRQLVQMAPQDRTRMGLAGRQKMEREFDEHLVIDAYRAQIAA